MSSSSYDEDRRLRAGLERAVRAVCPRWLRNSEDDLVQMAMMAVLRQREKGEADQEFRSSYLRRVAYTTVVDEIRRLRRWPDESVDDMNTEPTDSEPGPDPERRFTQKEIGTAIRRCLETVAEPRQQALTLWLLGYKVPAIAERLRWNRKRASNLVYRGLENLRDCLEKSGIKP